MLKTTRHKIDDYRALVMAGVKSVLIINNMNANTLNNFNTLGMDVTYIHNNEIDNDAELGGYILEEVKKLAGQHFDLIISNPPYKKIGAEITYSIVKNVDWGTFINLLPANDYTRVKGLIGHVDLSTLTFIDNAFEDAVVKTSVAKINKKPITITEDMFTLNTYDKRFQKFYAENVGRDAALIHNYVYCLDSGLTEAECRREVSKHLPDTSFLITLRTNADGVHKTVNCADYHWNVLKDLNIDDIHITYDKTMKNYHTTVSFIEFDVAEEKSNFTDFWYNGKLMNALLKGLNKTSGSCREALPKVDWTRKWTDEQILKEFGYTAEEIADIMASL